MQFYISRMKCKKNLLEMKIAPSRSLFSSFFSSDVSTPSFFAKKWAESTFFTKENEPFYLYILRENTNIIPQIVLLHYNSLSMLSILFVLSATSLIG